MLVQAGKTTVLCAASIDSGVPNWMAGQGRGWLTAEYSMLPGSTSPRKRRERTAGLDGRTTEIQRLIGRSLRAAIDLAAVGERTITIDCDVLEADGGTRTLSVTGGFIALVDALQTIVAELSDPQRFPIVESVAAVSVGMVDGQAVLDLDYEEDFAAAVDMNVVMTGSRPLRGSAGQRRRSHLQRARVAGDVGPGANRHSRVDGLAAQALGPLWPAK